MIKATAHTTDGRTILLLGITEMNMVRLVEGKPIQIHGEEVGIPKIDVWIIAGKDEAALTKMLAPFIGPETQVRETSKEPKQ